MSDNISHFELERMVRVSNNKTGSYIMIRPDRDGLNLIEVYSVTEEGVETGGPLLLEPSEAALVSVAIEEVSRHIVKT